MFMHHVLYITIARVNDSTTGLNMSDHKNTGSMARGPGKTQATTSKDPLISTQPQ